MNRPPIATVLAAVSALALLAACGPPPEGKEKTPDANPSATLLTPADETEAKTFVEKVVQNDMFEIEAAKIALARSTNAEVKTFAQTMIDAHTKTGEDLRTALAASNQPIAAPSALTDDQLGKLDALAKVGADDFDEAYMDDQISAHQEALNLMSRYANDGKFGPLKTYAVDHMGGVQAHLNSATSLEEKLD